MPIAAIIRSMFLPRGRLGPLAFAVPAAAVLYAHFTLRFGQGAALPTLLPPLGANKIPGEIIQSRLIWSLCGIATANLALARLHDTGWSKGLLGLIMFPAYALLALSISTSIPGTLPPIQAGPLAKLTPEGARFAYFAYSAVLWLLLTVLPSDPADNAHGPATREQPPTTASGTSDATAAWAESAVQAIELHQRPPAKPHVAGTATTGLTRGTFGRRG